MKHLYKLPTAEDRKLALGSLPGTPYRLRKALEQLIPLCHPMLQPKEGQWLWEHEEEGQSFNAYTGQMHNVVDQKRHIIYIKPLQNIDKQFLTHLKKYCQVFFCLEVKVLPFDKQFLQNIPNRINEYSQKTQYHAGEILKKLPVPKDGFCLIAITMTDLYPRDEWNFVFGLASISNRTGVFSFARYDERFFGTQPYEMDYSRLFWRSAGVMSHEITHMFGVRHCVFYKCLMNGSNHLEEAESKPLWLCVVCLRKLQSNVSFDILERYKQLSTFLDTHQTKAIMSYKQHCAVAVNDITNHTKT